MATKKLESPEKVFEHFKGYWKKIKSTPFLIKDWVGKDGREVNREKEKPLTMVGFENYLADEGIINDISDYIENKDGNYSEYVDVFKRIKRIILQDHQEGALCSIYHSGISARLNGWTDKSESTINANVTQITGMEIK